MKALESVGEFHAVTVREGLITPVCARNVIGISSSRWYAVRADFEHWEFKGEIFVGLRQCLEYCAVRKGRAGKRPEKTRLMPFMIEPATIQKAGQRVAC